MRVRDGKLLGKARVRKRRREQVDILHALGERARVLAVALAAKRQRAQQLLGARGAGVHPRAHFYTSDLDLGNLDEAATVMAHHVTKKREMQKHAAELVERNLVMLHLDRFQMGVGGIHSWGAKPLKEHLFTPDRSYDFSFVLRPYSPALADGKPTAVDEMAALAAEEAARGGMCPLPDL